jgi:hypothetical protein
MKNWKMILVIFLGVGAFVLLMQSRSTTTGKGFLGIGTNPSANSPWYEKLGAGAGTFFGSLSASLFGKKNTTQDAASSATWNAMAGMSDTDV